MEESIDLNEGLKERVRRKNLELQLGEISERFWNIIGQIKTLFPETKVAHLVDEIKKAEEELENLEEDLIIALNEMNAEIDKECSSITTNEERDLWVGIKTTRLDEWMKTEVSNVNKKIKILESRIDNLLNFVEDHLSRNRRQQINNKEQMR